MFCHRPVSMGSLLFVVLNLQSKIASFISKIFHNMQFSWILFVKQIFNECGLSNIWETKLFDNVDYLKCVIKQRLEELFVVLNLQSKIASFISKIFKYSSYLNSVLNVL
jgi:hypothetical protein